MQSDLHQFYKNMKDNDYTPMTSIQALLWSRFVSLVAVLIMIVHVIFPNVNCGLVFQQVYVYASYSTLLLHSIGSSIFNMSCEVFFLELFRDSVAALWSAIFSYSVKHHILTEVRMLLIVLTGIVGLLAIILGITTLVKKCIS